MGKSTRFQMLCKPHQPEFVHGNQILTKYSNIWCFVERSQEGPMLCFVNVYIVFKNTLMDATRGHLHGWLSIANIRTQQNNQFLRQDLHVLKSSKGMLSFFTKAGSYLNFFFHQESGSAFTELCFSYLFTTGLWGHPLLH